jgi:hypothetical protein
MYKQVHERQSYTSKPKIPTKKFIGDFGPRRLRTSKKAKLILDVRCMTSVSSVRSFRIRCHQRPRKVGEEKKKKKRKKGKEKEKEIEI